MLVHGKIASTSVNGPGNRSMIHVQGCTLNCKNCWNPNSHKFDLSKWVSEEDLLNWIIENAIDGVTFSGGEPMQQAGSLCSLIKSLKVMRPDLSIGMYTGYTLKELETNRYHSMKLVINNLAGYELQDMRLDYFGGFYWRQIKKNLDFAIMGRFNEQQLDNSRSLRSSRNQELVLFSDRYKESDFEQQEVEFTIAADGLIQITGFPLGLQDMLNSRDW